MITVMPKINPIISQHFLANANDDILKWAAEGLRDFVKQNVPGANAAHVVRHCPRSVRVVRD